MVGGQDLTTGRTTTSVWWSMSDSSNWDESSTRCSLRRASTWPASRGRRHRPRGGHGPNNGSGIIRAKVGRLLNREEGQAAARASGLSILATP